LPVDAGRRRKAKPASPRVADPCLPEICEKTAAQYWRPGRRLGDLDWLAQMKLLGAKDPSYRN
jgi:hypothetical protein